MSTIIVFKSRNEFIKVDLSKVAYMEADGNYCHLFFCNGYAPLVTISMIQMEQVIAKTLGKGDSGVFIRVGRKYILNSSLIVEVNVQRKTVILTDYIHPPVSISLPKESAKQLRLVMEKGQLNNAN